MQPDSLSPGSTKSVWWICQLNHEWTARIMDRTHGANGCPVCSGKRIEPGINDLQTTHTDAAFQWHPKKNGPLTPQDVWSTSTTATILRTSAKPTSTALCLKFTPITAHMTTGHVCPRGPVGYCLASSPPVLPLSWLVPRLS
ncbi:zinc-ribbon domain-containing protein [Arthrobacter sp. Edens01]|uniref:zinc-ribbon domain-containing protein n=1 Tax=Arthrobacter sp. Edens01 TaxID=1732020 RepID=UPI0009E6B7BC